MAAITETLEVFLTKTAFQEVFGPGGTTLSRLEQVTKARIEAFDSKNSEENLGAPKVRISGPLDAVKLARESVQEIQERAAMKAGLPRALATGGTRTAKTSQLLAVIEITDPSTGAVHPHLRREIDLIKKLSKVDNDRTVMETLLANEDDAVRTIKVLLSGGGVSSPEPAATTSYSTTTTSSYSAPTTDYSSYLSGGTGGAGTTDYSGYSAFGGTGGSSYDSTPAATTTDYSSAGTTDYSSYLSGGSAGADF